MSETSACPLEKLAFSRESLVEAWADLQPLLALNNVESGARSNLNPSFERYLNLESANQFSLFTMRRGTKLVGYATFFLTEHLHYQNDLMALQDVIFVVKDYRGRSVLRFVEWCDRELEKLGVVAILRHAGMKHTFGRLLKILGYKPQEMTYMRCL